MPRSQHDRYVPKHRQPPARRASRAAVRTMFVLSSAAVVGTGAAVAGGTLTLVPTGPADAAATLTDAALDEVSPAGSSGASGSVQASGAEVVEAASSADPAEGASPAAPETEQETGRRAAPLSRSDRRGTADPRKQAALAAGAGTGNAITRSEDASDDDPRAVAEVLVGDATQFGCLDSLWTKESGWRVDADNPSSSAYGIPQALPGSKMSSAGADWATNPVTQIRWGLGYIEDRYGSPCGAWSHSQSYNWY